MATTTATISRSVSGGEELVVVRRKDFEIFRQWQEQANDALLKVKRGREEYRRKKTVVAFTPRKFR